jgi:cytochrome c553
MRFVVSMTLIAGSIRRAVVAPLIAAGGLLLSVPALASAQDTSYGQRLFQDKADCQFCHGINGDGRGDPRSPGQASNLHKTILTREQVIEVITCGRPGTEMPHFDKYAYEDKSCYGHTAGELGADTPHDPHSTSLQARDRGRHRLHHCKICRQVTGEKRCV